MVRRHGRLVIACTRRRVRPARRTHDRACRARHGDGHLSEGSQRPDHAVEPLIPHLRAAADIPGPLDAPPPELAEYQGCPVTWEPWQPALRTSLDFHFDVSCDACGADAVGQPRAAGLVHRPGQVRDVRVHRDQLGRPSPPVSYGMRDRTPTRELGASRCTACGAVFVISLVEPGWSWTWGGPDGLPMGVEHRETAADPTPARPRRDRPRPAAAPPAPPAASEATRAAARAQLAADLAAKRGGRSHGRV